jgi:hypothetical protein
MFKLVCVCAGVGVPPLVLIFFSIEFGYCYVYKKNNENGVDSKILVRLKSLSETTKGFQFKELNKATNNFDNKLKVDKVDLV